MKNKSIVWLVLIVTSLFSGTISAQNQVLKFRNDKTFKIVQFTDTHIKAEDPRSDIAFKTIASVLDAEKPDLVVYTGDIVTGQPVKKGWELVLSPCIEREIPYAVVFGNHDDEQGMTRAELSEIVENMPNSLFVSKVEGVSGYGNYVLEVKSESGSENAALLYCLDSNAYSKLDSVDGYDWFKADQIDWYRKSSQAEKLKNGRTLPALAFFHIPLPEYTEAYANEKNPAIGVRFEDECSPKVNSGMYTAMLEAGDVMGTFVGHDHVNDYISYLNGIALTYGRFTGGKTTYGDLPNGGRVIELKEGERAFRTWIRTGKGEKLLAVDFPTDFMSKK